MKKILSILTVIALITVIGAAGLFAFSSFKNLTENKTELSEKTNNRSENDNDKKEEQQQEQTQEVNSNQQEQIETQYNQQENKNKELNLEEEIAKADKNGDGIATTDEMTPELEILAEQRAFQPVTPEMNDAEAHKKYEQSDEEIEETLKEVEELDSEE